VNGTTVTTYARDGLKSIRAELSGTSVTSAWRYRAYGEIAQYSGAATPSVLGYAGQLLDPSRLYYMRARWYDPANARFLSRDPVTGQDAAPRTLNAFDYAHTNPVITTDPSGACPMCVVLVLVAVKAFLTTMDVVNTAETLSDPSASDAEKTAMLGLFVAGLASEGGEATAARPIVRTAVRQAISRGERVGGRMTTEAALSAGEKWLGPEYREIGRANSGVFRSADDARQFRISTGGDYARKGPHVHFEAIGEGGRQIIENTLVQLIE
jgi:RHS repeat-associated protein